MRAPFVAAACVFAAAGLAGISSAASTAGPRLSVGKPACDAPSRRVSGRTAHATSARGRRGAPTASARGGKVAVQPIDGSNAAALRALVVRIVRARGFRTVTSLPRYEGTAQYPGLARDHRLSAFVTADLEERGRWQRITFLVWNGATGSVLARWSASGPAPVLARAVGRGFWSHLGPAVLKAEAPASTTLEPAPPMRIDAAAHEASNDDRSDDASLAQR